MSLGKVESFEIGTPYDFWVNIYENQFLELTYSIHKTEEEANNYIPPQSQKRVACMNFYGDFYTKHKPQINNQVTE